MANLEEIKRIAEVQFSDIVNTTFMIGQKLRIVLINNSYIDTYISKKNLDRFGFHWECMDEKKIIYRYDNYPDKNWQFIETFPYHFHNGSQNKVETSPFSLNILDGFRDFMTFVRKHLPQRH